MRFIAHILSFGQAILRDPRVITKLFSIGAWRRLLASEVAANPAGKVSAKERKMQLRKKAFLSANWTHEEGLSRRRYDSYEEYLSHQAAKFLLVQEGLQNQEERTIGKFVDRFRTCPELARKHTVLCLGARIGTEVKALLHLGHFAVGIDLNPGPGNQNVMCGDFHDLVFADDSIDAVYTNALDHAFHFEQVVSEVARVLRPEGIFLVDVLDGYEEGYYAGDFEALHWPDARSFIERLCALGSFELVSTRRLEEIGQPLWTQAVLQKLPVDRG